MKSDPINFATWLVMVICSYSFGLGQDFARAILPTCTQSCCEPLYAWDPGSPDNVALSAQNVGTTNPLLPNSNKAHAIPFVYLPAQTPGGCSLSNSGYYDQWKWKTWNYSCQDSSGNNPTIQQVTPTDPNPVLNAANLLRKVCVSSS